MATATAVLHRPTIRIKSLRAGRNGSDPPDALLDLQCVAAINIDWYRATVARKRPGSDDVDLSGGTTFTGNVNHLFRHVPGTDETAAELWAFDDTGRVKRMAAGTAFADMVLNDAITGNTQDISSCSFNGKLFIAYQSAQPRLHVYDPVDAVVRRAGLAKPTAAPSTGAPAAGAVTDTRTVKVAWTKQVAGVTKLRSELSAASGSVVLAAQQFVITRPTAPGEGETHWEVYEASATDGIYYLQSTIAIGTLTYADNAATLTTTTVEPVVGTNVVFPSVKYLVTDGNRLIGAGDRSGTAPGVIFISPVLGDNGVGDDERYVNSLTRQLFVQLNPNDGGGDVTALSDPIDGNIYAFKYKQIYRLTPTDDANAPYAPRNISKVVGCIDHRSLRVGEDAQGNPCLYFQSAQGPYRLSRAGLEYMGMDLLDLLPLNLNATTKVAFTEYYPDLKQLWMWAATGANNVPNYIFVFHTQIGVSTPEGVRGGWSVFTGNLAAARCACMFSATPGASMSKNLKPYVSRDTTNRVLKADSATAYQDGTVPFQAYVITKPYQPAGETNSFAVMDPILVAKAGNATIQVTVIGNDGEKSKAAQVSLVAKNPQQTRVRKKVSGARLANCQAVQYQIGDKTAINNTWQIDGLIAPYDIEQEAAA